MLAGLPPHYSLVLNTSEYLVSMAIHRRRQDTHASFVDSVVPMGSSP